MKNPVFFLAALTIACFSMKSAVMAADEDEKTGFDKTWGYMTLYENKENTFIQKFALSGRAQIDSVWVEPEAEEKYDELLWRRFRFGFKATLLQDWIAHLEGDFALEEELSDTYSRLTDAYIGWFPNKDFRIKALKQSAGFTLDGSTSSKKLLTPERSNLTNNLWFVQEYFTGLLAGGKFGRSWRYKASVFASDGELEIGIDNASWFTLLALGYDFDSTKIRLDYVYQDEHKEANTRPFEHVASLVTHWQSGPWGVWGDLSGGKGFSNQDQSDIWGLVIMPFYDIGKHTQVVLRYTYLDSKDDNGLRFGRYEDRVVDGRGDEYNELFAGFNVFFYGHKFKWQTGVSWAKMKDDANDGGKYEGCTLLSGLRISW